jgi:AraC-like DNA-binding protein
LDNSQEIRLRHSQHSFSINFSAIDFGNSQNRRFTWMLEGIDTKWNLPTAETTANYTNIGTGHYVFRLRYVGENNTVLDERTLTITVAPPFWDTAWARFLEIMLVAGLAVWCYFYIARRIKKKQTQERIDFFLRMARDIRNPLTMIKAPIAELKQMVKTNQHSEYLFDVIGQNVERLIEQMAHLLDYRKELEKTKDVKVAQQIEQVETITKMESEKKSYKILLVEGNEELRNFLSLSLGENMEVTCCVHPSEVWDIIQNVNPDIIITDDFAPELSSFDLLAKIKNTFETSHIPVIMMFTSLNAEIKKTALRCGIDYYVEKPFEMNDLMMRTENILNNRKLLRRKFIGISEQSETAGNEQDAKFISRATAIVEENLTNTAFSVSDFSQAMGLSRSLFYTKFYTLTGYSPNDYIKVIRMKKAIELFRAKQYSISEISFMVGFEEPAYFSICFKKLYGKTPTQFINEQLNQ